MRRYIETTTEKAPTSEEVQSAIGGAFSVDCSMEESGFCRGRGSSGTYPWTAAVFETRTGSDGASFSYYYLFEDCELDDADLKVTINLQYLGPGGCPSLNAPRVKL